jgi:hypothetical protein
MTTFHGRFTNITKNQYGLVQWLQMEGNIGIIFNWQSNKKSLIPEDVTVDNKRYEEVHTKLLEASSPKVSEV